MKLTALQAAQYLVRFYAQIAQLEGTKIGDTMELITVGGPKDDLKAIAVQRVEPKADGGRSVTCVSPELDAVCDFFYKDKLKGTESEMVFALIGSTGFVRIYVYLENNDERVDIPFILTFDMDTDVKNFIWTLNQINSVVYTPAYTMPGELSVKITDEFKAWLDHQKRPALNIEAIVTNVLDDLAKKHLTDERKAA